MIASSNARLVTTCDRLWTFLHFACQNSGLVLGRGRCSDSPDRFYHGRAQHQIPYRYPWNIITSSFLAPSLVDLAVAIAVLFGAAQAAEPIYGPTEFFKLISVAAVACGCTSFLLQYAWFYFHLSGTALFAEHGGFYGVQGALFVAIKHVMPGQDITLFSSIALPTRYLPGIHVLLLTVLSVITGDLTALRFAVVGTFSGWLYLRFFKSSGPDGAITSALYHHAQTCEISCCGPSQRHPNSCTKPHAAVALFIASSSPRSPLTALQQCNTDTIQATALHLPAQPSLVDAPARGPLGTGS